MIGTVEFAGADPDDAALVTVPPYHIAGMANLLSNVYAGRRIVYLDAFDAQVWLDTVRGRGRHPGHGRADHAGPRRGPPRRRPGRRSRRCARSPTAGPACRCPVLERALELFPGTGFVNAYGLTETSSTIALLGPDDHAAAFAGDPEAKVRLGSVGKVLPGIEVEVRDEMDQPLAGRRGRPGLPARRADLGRVRPGLGRRRRRLVPHPRPRLDRRRGLPLHRGPRRRHHHPRRREHRPGRDRGRPRPPRPRHRLGRGRHPRRRVGPAHRRRGRARRGRQPSPPTSCRTTAGSTSGAPRPPRSSSSGPSCPARPTGKLLRREVVADLTA